MDPAGHVTSGPSPLEVVDLGRMAYAPAWQVQCQTHQAMIDDPTRPPTLLLVEHEPVITVSQRKGVSSHLLASPQRLAEMGIDVQPTDRGGDITYHGPGQLVAYPILRLATYGLNVGGYMRLLEAVVIDTLKTFGVQGHAERGATGVWVRQREAVMGVDARDCAKICAMGVRVRRNITLHGLALNVDARLDHFATIVPCGLVGRPVTTMRQQLGDRTPPMAQVKAALAQAFRNRLGCDTLSSGVSADDVA